MDSVEATLKKAYSDQVMAAYKILSAGILAAQGDENELQKVKQKFTAALKHASDTLNQAKQLASDAGY